jgi:hypothetical protein
MPSSPSRSARSGTSSSSSALSSNGSCSSKALHLADAPANVGIHVLGAPTRTVDPRPQVDLDRRVEVARLERRLLLGPAGLHLVRPVVPREARSDEHERRDQVWPGQRNLQRDPPAEGNADECRA